jgi:hypothetical protein
MKEMEALAEPVALIGDIVDSRTAMDRQSLHDTLTETLERVNSDHAVLDPAVITLGDEFQGVYPTLGAALTASFHIRALLHPHDVRFGAGRGDVQTLDPKRGIYDGSAFWAARDAIVGAESLAAKPAFQFVRTAFHSELDPAALVAAVGAALLSLDQVVGSMSEVSRRILRGRLAGETQKEIAAAEGITPSAVSQRVIRDGIEVAMETMRRLGELP